MRKLLAGAAALALIAGGAYADPGKGNGGGNGGGKGGPAAVMHAGHGQGKSQDRGPDRVASAQGNGKAGRGPQMRAAKADQPRGNDRKAERAIAASDDRGKARVEKSGNGKAHRADDFRRNVSRDVREIRVVDDRDGRNVRTVVGFDDDRSRGLINGCPPGLAKKNNGCMPPGLAKDRDGLRDFNYRPSWFGYSGVGDGRYLYDDGYLYRMNDRGSVLGYIPLLGGALSVGNPWPSYYDPSPVPDYYVDYYNLGAPNAYRYADDVLYRVDPQTNAISSIAALLTGDQFAVGQRMPLGYDVYNVPYAYRDQYYDRQDAYYRYADGYVYQVDPTTQLIQAAIQLLT